MRTLLHPHLLLLVSLMIQFPRFIQNPQFLILTRPATQGCGTVHRSLFHERVTHRQPISTDGPRLRKRSTEIENHTPLSLRHPPLEIGIILFPPNRAICPLRSSRSYTPTYSRNRTRYTMRLPRHITPRIPFRLVTGITIYLRLNTGSLVQAHTAWTLTAPTILDNMQHTHRRIIPLPPLVCKRALFQKKHHYYVASSVGLAEWSGVLLLPKPTANLAIHPAHPPNQNRTHTLGHPIAKTAIGHCDREDNQITWFMFDINAISSYPLVSVMRMKIRFSSTDILHTPFITCTLFNSFSAS